MEHLSKPMERSKPLVRPISAPRAASTGGLGNPDCPHCGGLGYLRKDLPLDDPEFGTAFPCPCRGGSSLGKLQELSGLQEQERRLRLADIEVKGRPGTRRMVKECRGFVKDPIGTLTIHGSPGNGKTMAAQAVVNELTGLGIRAEYVTAHDLLERLQEGFGAGGAGRGSRSEARLQRYVELPVLVLDDFDKVHVTDWSRSKLVALMQQRGRWEEQGRAGTLIVMNCDPGEVPDAIASRLRDGRNRIVHNTDADIRPALKR
jgi:DNA replication protein DnaC